MARFQRLDVLQRMLSAGLVPVFFHPDPAVGRSIIAACADGGAPLVEFTNRGDRAFLVFSEIEAWAAQERPDVILGVGSVIDPATAALYINAGANFVVGPILHPEVARICNRRKIAYAPGCGSASEISQAEELGVEVCKVFPGGEVGGPPFVKAILGPCPWTKIMPTGGVEATRESVQAWIRAGAACLGMGSNLVTKDLVAKKEFAGITEKVRQVLAWIREARGSA